MIAEDQMRTIVAERQSKIDNAEVSAGAEFDKLIERTVSFLTDVVSGKIDKQVESCIAKLTAYDMERGSKVIELNFFKGKEHTFAQVGGGFPCDREKSIKYSKSVGLDFASFYENFASFSKKFNENVQKINGRYARHGAYECQPDVLETHVVRSTLKVLLRTYDKPYLKLEHDENGLRCIVNLNEIPKS